MNNEINENSEVNENNENSENNGNDDNVLLWSPGDNCLPNIRIGANLTNYGFLEEY